ncbi:MAG: hypothetical protein ACTS6G_02095 [Candidatus Hodgkinia cicadicola]
MLLSNLTSIKREAEQVYVYHFDAISASKVYLTEVRMFYKINSESAPRSLLLILRRSFDGARSASLPFLPSNYPAKGPFRCERARKRRRL